MFRKAIITALTVAVVATSAAAVTTTTASAKNGKKGAFAAGAIIGLATGAIIASTARPAPVYVAPVRRCHRKPVVRWSNYYHDYVVVGHRRVCNYY